VQLYPIPNENDLKKYYDNDMQVKEILSINNRDKIHYTEMLKNESLRRLNILEKNIELTHKKNIIDIGGGTCEFVKLIENKYINISLTVLEPGITRINEINEEKINKINQFLDDDFSKSNEKKYDIVTTFHVLEHVLNPIQFIKNCYTILKDDGLLYIEVPNQNNDLLLLSDYYKNNIWYCKAHISYFTKETLIYIFEKLNIKNYVFHSHERYDYDNYLHWITHNKPQKVSSYYKNENNSLDEEKWVKRRDIDFTSDAMYVIIYKNNL